MITVREVGVGDAAALARLTTEFTGLETSPEQMALRLERSRNIEHPIVAEMEGRVVGFASLRIHAYLGEDTPYAEISELFVTKAYRRRGVAGALMRKLEAMAHDAEAGSIMVLTADDNEAALSVYRGQGYREFSVALQKWLREERPYSPKSRESLLPP